MKYYTNHFINSHASLLDAVDAEYRKHWLLGLRQCELEIQAIEEGRGGVIRSLLRKLGWHLPLHPQLEIQRQKLLERRDDILREHPEVLELSSEEIQERYAAQCHDSKKLFYVATKLFAASNGIPEGVADIVLSLPPGKRKGLIDEGLAFVRGVEDELRTLPFGEETELEHAKLREGNTLCR